MKIAEVLHRKGKTVATVRAADTVETAVRKLAELNLGALLVVDRWGKIVGVLSERDVVFAVSQFGTRALAFQVDAAMNTDVTSCTSEDRVDKVMGLMTVHRVRHLPVIDQDHLSGIVSIGDLVKNYLIEKEQEASVLRDMKSAQGLAGNG
jgi:CBS domain-containing protein